MDSEISEYMARAYTIVESQYKTRDNPTLELVNPRDHLAKWADGFMKCMTQFREVMNNNEAVDYDLAYEVVSYSEMLKHALTEPQRVSIKRYVALARAIGNVMPGDFVTEEEAREAYDQYEDIINGEEPYDEIAEDDGA